MKAYGVVKLQIQDLLNSTLETWVVSFIVRMLHPSERLFVCHRKSKSGTWSSGFTHTCVSVLLFLGARGH